MDSLDKLLGQSNTAQNLVRKLSRPGARILLAGPSGSGKTHVADLVAARLAETRNVIRLSGSAAAAGTRFLAAHRALTGKRFSKPVREAAKTGWTIPLRMIPLFGGAAGELAKVAVNTLGAGKPDFLTAEQQDILAGLQKLGATKPTTLVVDDLQWLDGDTAALLLSLSREEVRAAYSFADGLSILFIETTDVAPQLADALLRQIRPAEVVQCRSVPREKFESVLRAFGLTRQVDGDLLDGLHAVSGGHLEMAKQIVRVDTGSDLASMLLRGDAGSLMSELLDSRLKGLDGAGALWRLLRLAACAGSAFAEEEVRCAFMDPEAFEVALRAARREELLTSDGEILSFTHEAIRAAVERLGTPEAAGLHGRLASCVKKLRPGDYPARLRHARLASDARSHREIAFAVAMASVRGEGSPAPGLEGEVGPLGSVLADAREAYRLMDSGEHRRAIDIMMPHYDGGDGLVQGEVVVLLALNHIKRRTRDAYGEAAALLELWKERRDEPEIWQRLMSVLLTAWAFLGQAEQASGLYAQLSTDLLRSVRSDPTCRMRLEALNRKADMFLTSELSAKHIARAVEWFGPSSDEGSVPRHGFEYTSSLVNLSGALFTCGHFADAARHAADALRWGERLSRAGMRTVEPYKALNNYVIAAHRAGSESPDALGAALDLLLLRESSGSLRDRSLLACNRGAIALLAGQTDLGLGQLETVWRHVRDADLDAYYTLHAASNLAVARALAGRRPEARALLEEVAYCLDRQPKWLRTAHHRRHAMMLRAVEDGLLDTAAVLDSYPADNRPPDGDQDPWWSVGRGLLLSDIQVWSEG